MRYNIQHDFAQLMNYLVMISIPWLLMAALDNIFPYQKESACIYTPKQPNKIKAVPVDKYWCHTLATN